MKISKQLFNVCIMCFGYGFVDLMVNVEGRYGLLLMNVGLFWQELLVFLGGYWGSFIFIGDYVISGSVFMLLRLLVFG